MHVSFEVPQLYAINIMRYDEATFLSKKLKCQPRENQNGKQASKVSMKRREKQNTLTQPLYSIVHLFVCLQNCHYISRTCVKALPVTLVLNINQPSKK